MYFHPNQLHQPEQDWGRHVPEQEIFSTGRQPNFLQKLYDFLNLDPHPCPEIIYWATDSRQLVVAHPDRLIKEVLPKLFKHDKLASFGRQLNIYGFCRLFPGRQFKDASGTISDASVWAHPTLHRLSSPSEIFAIKRRAAPKLVRTRKLANGQVIKSRAGPAVEAKFHEIRENIAESRRARQNGHVFAPLPISPTDSQNSTGQCVPIQTQQYRGEGHFYPQHCDVPMGSFASNQGDQRRLPGIIEGEIAENVSPQYQSFEHNSYTHQPLNRYFTPTPPGDHVGQSVSANPLSSGVSQEGHFQIQPLDLRGIQSCPASLHSTPLHSPSLDKQMPWTFHPTSAEHRDFVRRLSEDTDFTMREDETTQQPDQGLGFVSDDTTYSNSPNRIAAPAVPFPFPQLISTEQGDVHMTDDSFKHPTEHFNQSFTDHSQNQQYQPRSSSWVNPLQIVTSFPEQSVSPTTIDPRWVSPALSLWSTPVGTRSSTPFHDNPAKPSLFPLSPENDRLQHHFTISSERYVPQQAEHENIISAGMMPPPSPFEDRSVMNHPMISVPHSYPPSDLVQFLNRDSTDSGRHAHTLPDTPERRTGETAQGTMVPDPPIFPHVNY